VQEFVRPLQGEADPDTPLAKAHAILLQAYQEPDEERRVQQAHHALTLCPDCADAYVLLAEHARSRKEALQHYEQGVAAGERALGPEPFQRQVGQFWSLLETRPYLRARLGLTHALWTAGRRDEAVQHLQDMLRLNPNDHQGVRYPLAAFLLFLDRDDDLARLLGQYANEDSATWAYTKALLAFRQQGDTIDARRLLKRARKTNRHVPDYLLGIKSPPARPPRSYSPGDDSEARHYVGSFLVAWKATPGAVAWLRGNVNTKKAEAPHPKGPLGFIKKWLRDRLPQVDDVWQADFRQVPSWVRIGGEQVRPWVILVTSRSNDLVLAHQMPADTPSPALLWDTLMQAMQHPAAGEPHRPTELQVRPDERWEALRPHVEEIGLGLAVSEQLDHLDGVFQEMCERVCGKPQPGLLDVPGVTPKQVGGFYEAAASFFQQTPWKQIGGYEAAIQVECGKFQSGPWYAVLMGQSGLTTGLALYEGLNTLRRLWAGELASEENARQTVTTSVTFGEEWTIPVADLDAAKKYGWTVARPDAYPAVFHKERGLVMRPALAWELELLEGCLRAIPDFVNRHQQDDPAKEEMTVPVASGPLKLVLSWVADTE